ncbi:MAG: N-acetyl-gamma-glutamyl-phosphate reductase [Spirochaetales bacterium]|nr:N-acetyl-gamma-glutamyl-phosphate reductase [Spirochaetales bacterium]
MKAAILGTTGYTGMILLRLLAGHREITEILPGSSSHAGMALCDTDYGLSSSVLSSSVLLKTRGREGRLLSVEEVVAAKPDVVFAALPHLASVKVCAPFFGNTPLIDLSADLRLKDPLLFERTYGEKPPRPDILERAVYGLAEWFTADIKRADVIANPGCYPTATLLPLLPLSRAGLLKGLVITSALSGISGAGRNVKQAYLFCERSENTCAYSPGRVHRHQPEIRQGLDSVAGSGLDILFTPHLVPLKQGMAVTSVAELTRPLGSDEVEAVYREAYGDRPCVRLTGDRIPETLHVRGSNRCDIGWHIEGDRIILLSVIDNLWKGASGQAVQNMNIRFGFAEAEGLSLHGEI